MPAETIIEELEMTAGEPFELGFEITINDVPEPPTHYQAVIELRDKSSKGPIISSWDDASAELVKDDAEGLVTLYLPATTTRSYTFEFAYLDLLLIDPTTGSGMRSGKIKITLDRGVSA